MGYDEGFGYVPSMNELMDAIFANPKKFEELVAAYQKRVSQIRTAAQFRDGAKQVSHHDEFDNRENWPAVPVPDELHQNQRTINRYNSQRAGQLGSGGAAPLTGNDKPSNPKDSIATNKVPLGLFPPVAIAYGAVGMLEGKLKYGEANFRAVGVRASIYIDAALRHLESWRDGEDFTQDSGCDHLGNALACIAIILDARSIGKLVDDRQIPGDLPATLKALEQHVANLRAQYSERKPTHYTLDREKK